MVAREKARAEERFGRGYCSLHEAYGVLAEEVAEFFEQVRRRENERDYKNILLELVQIATVCAKSADMMFPIIDAQRKATDGVHGGLARNSEGDC